MRLLLVEANDMKRWVGGRVGRTVHVVPVALLGLAAYVKREVAGVDVRVVETSLNAATDEQLRQVLDDFRPDVVGIRSINFFVDETRRVVSAASSWGDVPVVVGGPIAAGLRRGLFERIPELRLAVVGEGERVLSHLLRGAPPEELPGMLVHKSGAVIENPETEPTRDLDELPWPDYSLIDLDQYAHQLSYAYNQRRQGVLVTSRGCPYHCTYCFQLPGTRARLRSARNVFGEIEQLVHHHDVRDFYVVDDVFNLSRRRAMELFDLIIEAKLGIRLYFVNGLRVDRCDREFIDRMVEAGTVWVTFGIESAHPRVAHLIKKDVDLDQAREVIGYAQRTGMVVNIDTMFGFPTETPAEAQVTLDWLGALDRPSLLPYHFNLRGYAGCEVVEQAVAAGWDREAFLATGTSSYHDLPAGTPTFSRQQMLSHIVDFHARFGMSNAEHLAWSVGVLRRNSFSDDEIVEMYSGLMNRRIHTVDELLVPKGSRRPADPDVDQNSRVP